MAAPASSVASSSPDDSPAPNIGLGLRIRLSLMMILQYYVWGIWLPMLAQHLGPNGLNLSGSEIGWIFSVYGLGAIAGPFLFGQIADRYLATEKVLFGCHLVGGLMLIAASEFTTFWPIFLLMLIYCCLYMPTMGLTNSLTFRALGEGNQNLFPGIRLWGTLGWIAAGLTFTMYLDYNELGFFRTIFELIGLTGAFESILGWWRETIVPALQSFHALPFVGEPNFRDCLRVAGLVSVVYGLYCLTLPHTPPIPAKETDPIDKRNAVLETLTLMRDRSFAVLVIVAGLIGIMLAFYFACENLFLENAWKRAEIARLQAEARAETPPDNDFLAFLDLAEKVEATGSADSVELENYTNLINNKIAERPLSDREKEALKRIKKIEPQIGAYMTIGQIAELVLMTLVPISIRQLGYKTTMIIGASAWAIRFGLSIVGQPFALMVGTIGLHGFAFGFFFVPAQMYVDKAASEDIKASAQSFLLFIIYGLGTVLGSVLAGWSIDAFGKDWSAIWTGPFVLTCLCIVAFLLLFQPKAIVAPKTTLPNSDIA
ncbi:hypothetical protein Isop_2663 [Isosphaera pallida ATCC 43644]|uniref:Major facilitator superfamily MFS_1 n=1 Tax=Isosphaera pallida (strain ATCC 43644 / DSM 9630 / IS1B) TaxID=575540 RepID=E8QZU2_ISOPI|nr:MFS transporter [Isosphaera pallida]ADV63233.1 hypothetical protein Isop_2663 [Isosphaera pallida ATCC 43644]